MPKKIIAVLSDRLEKAKRWMRAQEPSMFNHSTLYGELRDGSPFRLFIAADRSDARLFAGMEFCEVVNLNADPYCVQVASERVR